ncbi:MAG: hypothetical protein JWN76_570 [Chitinophagaceae bacterium]|nr:hypothetical protein [Chitinophagaceae bacterium]
MSNPFPPKNHDISVDEAIAMTKRYRENKENILAGGTPKDVLSICETFSREAIQKILADPKTVSFRIYYGMSEDLKIHAILVGSDENGADLLPVNADDDTPDPQELAYMCPPVCPVPSVLNT